MDAILSGGLTNALVATLLAAVCLAIAFLWRNPYVARGLWLAVMLKLVTPPVLELPTTWLEADTITDRTTQVARVRASMVPILVAESPRPGVAEAASFAHSTMKVVSPRVEPVALPDIRERDHYNDAGVFHRTRQALAPRSPSAAIRTADVAACVWLTGTVFTIVVVAFRIARFHRMVAKTKPAPTSLRTQAEDLAAHLGMARVPRTCIVDSRLPPLVWSLGRGTTILLPARLFNRLSPDRAAAVLAHELMHVRRRDHWVRWIEVAVVCAFWWHPVAWFARRKLQQAEERCCDADVLRAMPQIRRGYAEALLETLDFLAGARPVALVATGFTQRSSVVRRFEMIVKSRPAARPLLSVRGPLLGAVLLALLASPVASPAQPEQKHAATAPEGIPCTVTLKDGTTMEGYIVRLADDRVVIRRRMDLAEQDPKVVAEADALPRTVDAAQQEFWDVALNECVRICLLNSDVVRQLNLRSVTDGTNYNLVWISEEGGQSRLLDVGSGVENVLRDIETAYWELWRCHRELNAVKSGRDATLEVWREEYEAWKAGDKDLLAGREAKSKAQYFAFRSEVETATSDLRRAEKRLRYILGLAKNDGRLIRPADEPEVESHQNWSHVDVEALSRRTEIVKALERINAIQEELAESQSDGEAKTRHSQLKLAREQALLRDTELEISHQVADAVRDVERDCSVVESRYVHMVAAQHEDDRVRVEFRHNRSTLDLLLDAQQRRVDAERNYYEAAADCELSIMRLHARKGSLLDRHGVSIAAP